MEHFEIVPVKQLQSVTFLKSNHDPSTPFHCRFAVPVKGYQGGNITGRLHHSLYFQIRSPSNPDQLRTFLNTFQQIYSAKNADPMWSLSRYFDFEETGDTSPSLKIEFSYDTPGASCYFSGQNLPAVITVLTEMGMMTADDITRYRKAFDRWSYEHVSEVLIKRSLAEICAAWDQSQSLTVSQDWDSLSMSAHVLSC